MKHPFEAILPTDGHATTDTSDTTGKSDTPTRRQMIGRTVSAGAVAAGIAGLPGMAGLSGLAGSAHAASPANENGTDGSSSKPPADKPQKPGQPTSTRNGEEGVVTTQAIGEEGGLRPGAPHGGATTKRLGEEGAGTTKAMGEEGGFRGPPPKPKKFPELKKLYETNMKKENFPVANSYLSGMINHPEADKHKNFIDEAKTTLNKIGLAILAEAKAADKKGDLMTAYEKARSLETYFISQLDVTQQAANFHNELRTRKGYKKVLHEVDARQILAGAEQSKSIEVKRRCYQILTRKYYADTEAGKKAAELLKKLPPPQKVKPKPNPGAPRATTLALGEEG